MFLMSVSSYTPKSNIFRKILNSYNKFWSNKILTPSFNHYITQIKKNHAKSIETYNFLRLYTKLPHDKLNSKLLSVADFAFKGRDETLIRLSNNGAEYRGKQIWGELGFSKTSVEKAIHYLIENCYFNVENMTVKPAIGMPTGNDPASFWENIILYSYEKEYMPSLIFSNKIKARHFHSTKRFMDDICAINDGGEFESSICEI